MIDAGSPSTQRRAPSKVMRLARLGSFHQTRLSFMRILLRRMATEGWQFEQSIFDIDERGVGHAVYQAKGPERTYSLVAFAHDLPADQRSDRVIAEAWDATFALFDGVPGPTDIERLGRNVPRQEAGRVSDQELCLSRANRSVRLWAYILEELSAGRQPDADQLADIGYLMRTTAVYGSGKFGLADRELIAERPEANAPFQLEMLCVYLIRTFARDLLNHLARCQGGAEAVELDKSLGQLLGIGNSTGLGMAPFLINHPVLLNNWIMVREEAIARVRALEYAKPSEAQHFLQLFKRACHSLSIWRSEHPVQCQKLDTLRGDVSKIKQWVGETDWQGRFVWDQLAAQAEDALGQEAQEWLLSLILEPYGALVDGLSGCLADAALPPVLDGSERLGDLTKRIEAHYDWALSIDWKDPQNNARIWYVSVEKSEPRLGERFDEPLGPYEQPLQPGRDIALAYAEMKDQPEDMPLAEFLGNFPQHRGVLKRLQMQSYAPYSEIRDNTIAQDMMPIDMLRCKLSFFGATHFDPRSDRWVRIKMFGGAPYPEDLIAAYDDHWVFGP